MTCRKCKKEIPDGSRYCNQCGADQQPPDRSVKKRGNGQGTVYKRGRSWTACATVYTPSRQTLTRTYPTRKEAVAALPGLRTELLGARAKRKGTVTLEKLYESWSTSAMMKLSDSKQTAYKIAWRRLKELAQADIKELTIGDLQACVDAGADTYYKARDMKVVLSHLYKRACAQGDVPSNLAQYIVLPPLEETEQTSFSDAEQRALWKAYEEGDTFVGYILLMMCTGMMPGELFKCKVDMIDFDRHEIVGCGLKTKKRKTMPIVFGEDIEPVLRDLAATAQTEYLLPVKRNRFYDLFDAALKKCGCRDLTPYACRHTAATKSALANDIAPSEVQQFMRHGRLETTQRYIHPDTSNALKAANTIRNPITGALQTNP